MGATRGSIHPGLCHSCHLCHFSLYISYLKGRKQEHIQHKKLGANSAQVISVRKIN